MQLPISNLCSALRHPAPLCQAKYAAMAALASVACLLTDDVQAAPSADGAPFVELRLYPAGQIAGLGWWQMLAPQDRLGAALMYNRARRGNNGSHDDERGDGFGAGLAWDHFLAGGPGAGLGWSLGARADVFALQIDYRDASTTGRSRVTVLQPTATAGYSFVLVDSRWRIGITAGLGAEINVSTSGAKVGQGAIGWLGLTVSLP